MKNKTLYTLFTLLVSLAVFAAACGNANDDDTATPTTAATTSTTTSPNVSVPSTTSAPTAPTSPAEPAGSGSGSDSDSGSGGSAAEPGGDAGRDADDTTDAGQNQDASDASDAETASLTEDDDEDQLSAPASGQPEPATTTTAAPATTTTATPAPPPTTTLLPDVPVTSTTGPPTTVADSDLPETSGLEALDPTPAALGLNTEPVSSNPVSPSLQAELIGLPAEQAVELLHEAGYSSDALCGEEPYVEDFALPGLAYPLNPARAKATAANVEASVAEYYQVTAEVYRDPSFELLLCLTRVVTEPLLKWDWIDLQDLSSERVGVEFLQPTDVHVVGLATGYALAVACLPAGMYGPLALDDQPIAAFMLMEWAGGRWRATAAEETVGLDCDELVEQTIFDYQSDVFDDGSVWLLSFDQFETILSNSG